MNKIHFLFHILLLVLIMTLVSSCNWQGKAPLKANSPSTTPLPEELSLTPKNQFPYHVFALEEDKFGNLWIGDRDTGAWRFDGRTLTHYTSKDGLANNFVRVIYKDKKGELWFGQEHGGISKFNGASFDKAF